MTVIIDGPHLNAFVHLGTDSHWLTSTVEPLCKVELIISLTFAVEHAEMQRG